MGDIFSIETRKYVCFRKFCIETDICNLDKCQNVVHVKQWKYVPLNPKGPQPILTWQEMHTQDDMVSLDHDWVSNIVRKGTQLKY